MKNKYNNKGIIFSIIGITITAMTPVADNSPKPMKMEAYKG